MSEQKPYQVEATIDAPGEAVWRALTEPAEIREWFGWDYDGIDAEIRHIFVDNATLSPPDRIEFGADQEIRLEPAGDRTVVRVVVAGGLAGAEWDDIYDGIEEGWRAFLEQLRYLFERRPAGRRRTIFLSGTARVPEALAMTGAVERRHDSRYQSVVVDTDGSLVAVLAQSEVDAVDPGPVTVTVSTYGLDDTGFAATRERWVTRWQAVAKDAEVT